MNYVIEVHVSQLFQFAISNFIHWCKIENCRQQPFKTEHESFYFYPNITREQALEVEKAGYLVFEE